MTRNASIICNFALREMANSGRAISPCDPTFMQLSPYSASHAFPVFAPTEIDAKLLRTSQPTAESCAPGCSCPAGGTS